LQGARVGALVRQLKAAGVPQHVRMRKIPAKATRHVAADAGKS